MIDDERAKEIEDLWNVASPGPWKGYAEGGMHKGRVEEHSDRGHEVVAYTYCGAWEGHGAANAKAVASAASDVPDLLQDRLERKEWQERARALLQEFLEDRTTHPICPACDEAVTDYHDPECLRGRIESFLEE